MNNSEQNMAAFLGYEEVAISKEIGGKKSVKVKCLPVRKFAEFMALFTIEVELVGLCTDLTDEEIDMLTPEDSGRIFEKAHELNDDPFTAWLRRKTAAARTQALIYGVSLPKNVENPNGEDSANSSAGLSQTAD